MALQVWYVQSALAINEFKSPRWQHEYVTSGDYIGHTVCAALFCRTRASKGLRIPGRRSRCI